MVSLVHSDDEWLQIVQQAEIENKALIVEFSAEWCGPCKRIFPQFQRHAVDGAARGLPILFVKVDVDGASQTAQACGVASMPTFQAYYGKSMLGQFSGADQRALSQFVEKVTQHMTSLSTSSASVETVADITNEETDVVDSTADVFAGRIICVDKDAEWRELVKYARANAKPIIAQFFAVGVDESTRANCDSMYELFGEHCRARAGKALFAKVNASSATETADACNIVQVPTFLSMHGVRVIDAFAGDSAENLAQLVDNAIAAAQ